MRYDDKVRKFNTELTRIIMRTPIKNEIDYYQLVNLTQMEYGFSNKKLDSRLEVLEMIGVIQRVGDKILVVKHETDGQNNKG